MKVRKLRVVRVSKNFVVVEDGNVTGSIHISEVGNYYIKNLEDIFGNDDILYGVLINKDKRYYSLKKGHTIEKPWLERGGGFSPLKYFMNNFERKK